MAAPKKKTPAKAKAAKTTATNKTRKKSTSKQAKQATVQSFRRSDETVPFLTLQLTVQTFYWMIIGGLVLALGLWVMTLNMQLQDLYDQVELNSVYSDSADWQMMHEAHKSQKTE